MPVRAQIKTKKDHKPSAPRPGSKTQLRKANKASHMHGTKGFK